MRNHLPPSPTTPNPCKCEDFHQESFASHESNPSGTQNLNVHKFTTTTTDNYFLLKLFSLRCSSNEPKQDLGSGHPLFIQTPIQTGLLPLGVLWQVRPPLMSCAHSSYSHPAHLLQGSLPSAHLTFPICKTHYLLHSGQF